MGATFAKLSWIAFIWSGVMDLSPSAARPTDQVARAGCPRAPLMRVSHARFGEARRALRQKALAQVIPPGQPDAGHVERQEDHQRQMRAAGGGDRGAEAARDQIAAAGADRADESERGGALDAGRLHGGRPAGFARALRLLELLFAE